MSSAAWAIAASDLGIRVAAPFQEADRYGVPLSFIAHIRDFGASNGTLVWYMPDPLPTPRMRLRTAYFISALNLAIYADYDRKRFVTLLSGWGWAGMDAPPSWYVGN